MKTYIELLNHPSPAGFLHYWSVETTIEEFVQQHKELGLVEEKKELSDIESKFPRVNLSRTLKENIPIDIKIKSDMNILAVYGTTFLYPKGTTHFKVDLYRTDSFTDLYLSERNVPVALKIIGNVESNESTWHTYKVVDGVEQWVELSKGTRCTSDIHSIAKIEEFEQNELETEPYTIDLVSEKLEKGSTNRLLLEIYSLSLSDFFDMRLKYERLVDYFKLNRVYPITKIDENTYYVDEVEERNNKNQKLNEIFYNVVIDQDFKKAYNEVLGGV